MKRIIYILFLLLVSFTAIAQETPPSGLKAINAQFYIHLPDSSIWQQKGSPYNWHRVAKYSDLFGAGGIFKLKTDSTANSGYVTHGYFNRYHYSDGTVYNSSLVNSNGFVFLLGDVMSSTPYYMGVDPSLGSGLFSTGPLYKSNVITDITGGISILTQRISDNKISSIKTNSGIIQISDQITKKGITHDATIDRNTWDDNTYIDKRLLDSTVSVHAILPDSALHANKNLYDVPNKATALANLGGIASITDTATYLYRRTSWTDFNDFVAQGSYTLSNGKIHVTPGQSDLLSVNRGTGLQKCILSYTYRATNGLSNAAGIRFGWSTLNNTASSGMQFWFDETTRKINIYDVVNNSTFTGTSILPAYTSGDLINIQYQNIGYNSGTLTVKNLTTGASITLIKQNKYVNPSAPNGSYNTGQITILPQNTTVAYDVSNIEYSTPFKPGGNMYVGDSWTAGSASTVLPGGFAYQLNGQIDAGSGDKSREVLLRLAEIIALKPATVYLLIGTNDTVIATWQANVVSIVAGLRAAGIRVITMTPGPMNATNKKPMRDSLFAMYPTSTIDLYTPLLGTGFAMNATYDSGDGVHPNQLGHNLIASTISGNSLYSAPVYNKTLDTTVVVKKLNNTQVVPGWYGFSPIKIRADGRIESTGASTLATNLALVYNNAGVPATTSAVTYSTSNSRLISTAGIQATNFYGTSVLNFTSQGTNTIDFFTQSMVNRVARAFNTGNWVLGVGAATDAGFGLDILANGARINGATSVTGNISTNANMIANNFYGISSANLTSQGTNTVSILTQSATNRVAEFFNNGHAIFGAGAVTDAGFGIDVLAGGARISGDVASTTSHANSYIANGSLPTYINNVQGGTQPVDTRISQIVGRGRQVSFELLDDSFLNGTPYMTVDRTGFTPNRVTYPNGVIRSTQNKVVQDTSYATNSFQSFTPIATYTAGARPGFSFFAETQFGGYLYMAGLNDFRVRQSDGTTGFFMLNPMTSTGDIITSASGGTPSRLGIGSSGQVLTVSGGVPTWAPSGVGTVTNVSSANSDIAVATGSSTPVLTLNNVNGVTKSYYDPTSSIQTQLNGKQGSLTLTTTGSSGAATLIGNTLNIPNYASSTGTVSRLQSFYNSVVVGTSVADIYSYTVPGNSLVNNGGYLDVSFDGVMLAGATYQFELFFAGNSIFSQASGATTGVLPGDRIAIHFKIYKTGTSTAYIVGSVAYGEGASTFKRIFGGLTGLDFTTGNILKIAGAGTLGSFSMSGGDIIAYQ